MGELFKSENTLFPFQGEHIVRAYNQDTTLLVWDTGMGKSVGALALAALMLENDKIDIVVLVAENNKLIDDEWPSSIVRFTNIEWKLYLGAKTKREKIRADLPQMILTSFDTLKIDAAIFPPKTSSRGRQGAPKPGPLLEALEGKRVLVIYDETTRIANRKSNTHIAHRLFVETLRAGAGCYVLAMTATPMEKDPSSFYNLGRILTPDTMCTVDEFERTYVSLWDAFRTPVRYKNIDRDPSLEPGVTPLSEMLAPIILRKRKSDPDVVNSFPKRREMPPNFVTLGDRHLSFYRTVAAMAAGLPDFEQRQFVNTLRQIAAHPMSLTRSDGGINKDIVDVVTAEGLALMGSAKTDKMMSWCQEVVRDQGAQAVIFTFFAQSVLPLLQESLENAGYRVSVNHGGLSMASRNVAQQDFKRGDTEIFLTSDAGSKGLNLPNATYLLHYELPSTHANMIQRSDRIHRIDSMAEAVYVYSLVAADTIEEGFLNLNLRRNAWADRLLGDDEEETGDFMTADDRRELLKIGKRQAKGK